MLLLAKIYKYIDITKYYGNKYHAKRKNKESDNQINARGKSVYFPVE
jgi:hypothetical protein